MAKLFAFLLLCCCHATCVHAQQRLSLPDADAIGLNAMNDNIEIYTQTGPDRYTEKTLRIRPWRKTGAKASDIMLLKWNISANKETVSKKAIDAKHIRLIEGKDLQTTDLKGLVGKAFTVNDGGKWKRKKEKATLVLKFLKQDVATLQQLIYDDGNYRYSIHTIPDLISDDVVAWRFVDSEYFIPLVLELKGGKKVFLLYNDKVAYVVTPTPGGSFVYKCDAGNKPTQLTYAADKYATVKAYDYIPLDLDRFYGVFKTPNGKYRLLTMAGDDALKAEYDSISFLYRFIFAKQGDKIDIFSPQLYKMNIGKPKMVRQIENPALGCIEVLTDKGACYYDETGKAVREPLEKGRGVCGTVTQYIYDIVKDKASYQVKRYEDDQMDPKEETRYCLSDLLPTDAVTFLDGKKHFYWDDNGDILGYLYVRPTLVRVGRWKKFGIMEYKYEQQEGVKPRLDIKKKGGYVTKTAVYPPVKITGKTLLPIIYDAVIMREDGLIYFYKNRKVGLFPRDKAPTYDEIKKVTKSFYRIVKNGTMGWLDVKTGKEYWK